MEYMTIQEAKDKIVETINVAQGVKATQLAVMNEIIQLQHFNVPLLLNDLVREGRIVEVEYVLPEMKWRIKSFYLPAGSELRTLKCGDPAVPWAPVPVG